MAARVYVPPVRAAAASATRPSEQAEQAGHASAARARVLSLARPGLRPRWDRAPGRRPRAQGGWETRAAHIRSGERVGPEVAGVSVQAKVNRGPQCDSDAACPRARRDRHHERRPGPAGRDRHRSQSQDLGGCRGRKRRGRGAVASAGWAWVRGRGQRRQRELLPVRVPWSDAGPVGAGLRR